MVGVAQQVELLVVVQAVAGSSPVAHLHESLGFSCHPEAPSIVMDRQRRGQAPGTKWCAANAIAEWAHYGRRYTKRTNQVQRSREDTALKQRGLELVAAPELERAKRRGDDRKMTAAARLGARGSTG
jgi:hypothetical protein